MVSMTGNQAICARAICWRFPSCSSLMQYWHVPMYGDRWAVECALTECLDRVSRRRFQDDAVHRT
jgi:hypothetical protein